ncbi:hypothetical protein [Flavobacterium sp.]|uniref:hypothetical protein n=1 Tax=Flavobacterium sp. TaxID=239 RepID=UPI002B4B2FB3|nr:hypothetical protein [Flavobacterium sp.]HLF53527.1 hypothetical protein [Flavobacterium sp.]
MEIALTVRNVVIIGGMMPSKFDKYFFLKNNIFNEGDILETSQFSNEFSLTITPNYSVQIAAGQFILTELKPDAEGDIENVARRILECSDDFEATGVGVNIQWFNFTRENTRELSKKYFFNSNLLINKFFDGADTSYGYYISKNFGKARLKLDIKPAKVVKVGTTVEDEILTFTFNFHVDLLKEQKSKAQIIEVLQEIEDYTLETKKIVDAFD